MFGILHCALEVHRVEEVWAQSLRPHETPCKHIKHKLSVHRMPYKSVFVWGFPVHTSVVQTCFWIQRCSSASFCQFGNTRVCHSLLAIGGVAEAVAPVARYSLCNALVTLKRRARRLKRWWRRMSGDRAFLGRRIPHTRGSLFAVGRIVRFTRRWAVPQIRELAHQRR